ncbi:hypothetical protein Tco_1319986 [Tanacetum coccineum]
MGIGVYSNAVATAASLIGCSILTAPFNYLGVKVGSNMSRISSWDDVISKGSSRLSKWKLKLLSIGGRLTLLKSVLTSILLYHMSIFKVPIGVLNHLESIRRNFFYGVDGSDRKLAWIGGEVALKYAKRVVGSENYGLLGRRVADLVLPNISDRWEEFQLDGLESFPSRCFEVFDRDVVVNLALQKSIALWEFSTKFLWNHGSSGKANSKVAWEIVCLPKDEGGLAKIPDPSLTTTLQINNEMDMLVLDDRIWATNFKSVVAKLVVAARLTIFGKKEIWRLLPKRNKRKVDQLIIVFNVVRLKLLSCKLKKSKSGERLARLWDLPDAIFI